MHDRGTVAKPSQQLPSIELFGQLAPGTRLVPEAHKCPGPHRWYNWDSKEWKNCPICGGTGKVLGWRMEKIEG